MELDELTILANKYKTDKGTDVGEKHYYTKDYFEILNRLKNEKFILLEIGIHDGSSLKMWSDFFINAEIYGIDKHNCSNLNTSRIICLQADQGNREELKSVLKSINKEIDVLIDDGGHHMSQQQISLAILLPFLKNDGFYFIEDLHTSNFERDFIMYEKQMEINEDRTNTTLYMIKKFIETRKIESEYMTIEEIQYLNKFIKNCVLFNKDKLCLITKN
jgi:hypothetical protein